jgi:hypothetical protein
VGAVLLPVRVLLPSATIATLQRCVAAIYASLQGTLDMLGEQARCHAATLTLSPL